MKKTMLSAVVAAILLASSITHPSVAMDQDPVRTDNMAMTEYNENLYYLEKLLTKSEEETQELIQDSYNSSDDQEYVDKRKNIIKNNFLNRIELLHYRLPKNIIDRMQAIAQALGFTLPKVDIATDDYITHKKQDSILASIQEDFETFKDTVRERLSILKGNDLTPEQKKKALALATQFGLKLDASMFGDQKDINPFQHHGIPGDIMGIITQHAQEKDPHALNKAAIVDKQMHSGAQPTLDFEKDQLERAIKIIVDLADFFDDPMQDRIFGTKTTPPTITREEAQEILNSEFIQNGQKAIQFSQQNQQYRSTIISDARLKYCKIHISDNLLALKKIASS